MKNCSLAVDENSSDGFTSVRNEADRVGPMYPIGFTHVGSRALRAHFYARCGSGGWSSGSFLNTVECIPHQSIGCGDEGWARRPLISASRPVRGTRTAALSGLLGRLTVAS
jgi:hypothetical protein